MTFRLSRATRGTADHINSFIAILTACIGYDVSMNADGELSRAPGDPTEGHRTVTELFDAIVAHAGRLTMVVGSGQRDVVIDLFRRRELDVADLMAFPATTTDETRHITTRCEMLAHILAEYLHALQNGRTTGNEGFDDAHQAGLNAQTQHRRRNGQEGRSRGNEQYNEGRNFGCAYTDGHATIADLRDGNLQNVRPR